MCLIWATRVIQGLFKYFYIWFPDKMLTCTFAVWVCIKLQHISTLVKAVIMNCNEDLSNFGNGTENVIRLFHRVVCFEFLSCLCDGGIHFFYFIFVFFCFFLMWFSLYSPRDSKNICTKTELGWIFRNISSHLVKSSFLADAYVSACQHMNNRIWNGKKYN